MGEPPRGAEFTLERPLELPFDKFLRKLSRTPGQPATRDANLCVAEASLCVPRTILYTYVCFLPACMYRCIQGVPRLNKFCQYIYSTSIIKQKDVIYTIYKHTVAQESIQIFREKF